MYRHSSRVHHSLAVGVVVWLLAADARTADAACGALLQLNSLEGNQEASSAAAANACEMDLAKHKYEVFLSHKVLRCAVL
jgi:hypothetical protein